VERFGRPHLKAFAKTSPSQYPQRFFGRDAVTGERGVRIDLSREDPFRVGALAVTPAFRQISRGGQSITVEPRVMQVLVALARAEGGIVGRDDLIESCWDGRIVGDNAINRVISILRQLSTGLGEGSFSIETITKVGYRLLASDSPNGSALPPQSAAPAAPRLNRRLALLLLASGLGGATWLGWRSVPSPRRRRATLLYRRGLDLQGQGDDNTDQAMIYFARAVGIDPDFAEAWGALALIRARRAPPGDAAAPEVLEKVRSDAARALQLDPKNRDASLALILVEPYWRNWGKVEREARAALVTMPEENVLRAKLGSILSHVGRFRDSVQELTRAVAQEPLVPAYQIFLWRALWGVGDLAAARTLLDRAQARWPANPSVWLSRYTFLSLTGDVAGVAALRGGAADGQRDDPLPIDLALAAARAIASGNAAARTQAVKAASAAAADGTLPSFLAIQYFSALRAVDQAFAVSYDLYFGKRDPQIGERELAARHDPRMTFFLFQPPTEAMRADPRFAKLTRAMGLDDYWRESATSPDFRHR
jgi:DNA-binding winged helix-turn-helix (wHTH) protein/Tfp pilus assembly protein PilF